MRENKGELLIRNTLITPGDWFRSFIRHVMENKGELLIWNPDSMSCMLTFIHFGLLYVCCILSPVNLCSCQVRHMLPLHFGPDERRLRTKREHN